MIPTRKIDHIVYTVFDLDAEMDRFEKILGVRPVFGGYHETQGTKNALLNLGNDCYLELLSVDKTNMNIKSPRWMGVDLLMEPKITRWAIKSTNLNNDSRIIKEINPNMGAIKKGSRKINSDNMLKWELIMPLPDPEVELYPFMIDWSQSDNHPTDKLPQLCKLSSFYETHPKPELVKSELEKLNIDIRIDISEKASIRATIQGPIGIMEL